MENEYNALCAVSRLVQEKHKDQKYGEESYIEGHTLRVMDGVKEVVPGKRPTKDAFEYTTTALLHDILEDTDCTEQEVYDIVGEEVLQNVLALSRSSLDANYNDYLKRCAEKQVTFIVKVSDLTVNMNKCLREGDLERAGVYATRISKLIEFRRSVVVKEILND